MTLRIALLLLATWAITRLVGPASELVHVLLLVGLLLLLIGMLKARDAAVPAGTVGPNQPQDMPPAGKDSDSPGVRAQRGGRR
jgi:hypothetical protein